MLLTPPSTRVVTRMPPSGSDWPRLVKTWTTPLAASEPYNADAAAPLTISTRSTSSPAISARPNRVITPSTMISGSWRPPILVAPRSRRTGSPPGCAEFGISRTPATLPSTAWSAVPPGTACSWSVPTVATVIGSLRRSVASATPVTTTSSSRSGSAASWKSCCCSPPVSATVRVIGLCPM